MSEILGDVQAAVDAGRAAVTPHLLNPGSYYVVQTGGGVEHIDLTDLHLERPRRIVRGVQVTDVESFLAYWGKFAADSSEVFAHRADLRVTAVIDAPDRDQPNWGDHLLVLRLHHSPAWMAWKATDRTWMRQESFAEHIEDRLGDIIRPDGAEMLEVAQSLQATTRVSFQSGFRLVDGQRQLAYVEETQGTAGARGQLSIPAEFDLGLPVFRGSGMADEVQARLRYRVRGGELSLSYALERVEERVDDAFAAVVDEVAAGTGCTVFRG